MIRVGFGVSALAKGIKANGLDGIGNYTNALLTQFSKHTDLSLTPFSFDTEFQAFDRLVRPQNATVHLGNYALNTAWSVATGANFLGIQALTKQIDLLHATDHYVPKGKPVPLVATLMDAMPLSHPQWSRGKLRSIKNWLWTRAANWADEVITISEYSKIELSTWAGIPLKKITVIPLGVDERWFREVSSLETARVRAQYQLPETFFISVGTLQPRKNIERTISAHRLLSQAERLRSPLMIVGRAGWKCDEALRLIDEDAATGAVRWLQHVPDADLLAVLKLATALVFPSLGEGFGLPVLEAFAAGVPVITSNTTSLPEVTGDAAIAINPLDVDQLKEAMRQVLQDEALVKRLKARGLKRAQSFTWQACTASTLQVYQRVVQQH